MGRRPPRRLTYHGWVRSRVSRLFRPAAAFAVTWAVLAAAVRLFDLSDATLRTASKVVALPLWFLAAYLVVVAVAPAMIAAHRRLGVAVLLAVGAGAVDLIHHGLGVGAAGWVNFALVWLLAHQLGVLWRDGTLTRWRSTPWLVAGTGLAGLVVLTQVAGYPVSLVGGVGQTRTNTHPPSLAIVANTLLQAGLAVALRRPVDRWLARPRAWAAVVAANTVAMTVYLWHLTALVVVSLVLLPAGWFPQPDAGSAAWWAWRPAWIVALVVALVPLVALFARVERRRVARPVGREGRGATAVVAAVLSAAGMTVLALRDFAPAGQPLGLPLAGLGLLVAGPLLFRLAVPPSPSPSYPVAPSRPRREP